MPINVDYMDSSMNGNHLFFLLLFQMYNDRRPFYGGGAGMIGNDNPNADRRGNRGRGK